MSDINYEALAGALLAKVGEGLPGLGVRTKGVSSTPTAYYGHGDGGLFSFPGLSQQLFSAMILPRAGLQGMLRTYPSEDTNPLYGIITGVTATNGSEPNGVCDDPPTSGLLKLCTTSLVFGRYSRMTRVFDLDRIGKRTNRGEFSDFLVAGNPMLGAGPSAVAPSFPGVGSMQDVARNEISKAIFELAVAWQRDFCKQLYTGNPTNNTGGGGYKEFYGLDKLINTGYRDAETGVACAAADSIVRDFGDIDVEANGAAAVKQITSIFRNLKHLASKANLEPASWVISMTFGLFYQLTEVWPVVYSTFRGLVAVPTGVSYSLNADSVETFRSAMRGDLYNYRGQYLLIDGQQVPVVIDDAITETENGNGTFTSDIYFVPLTVMGGQEVTFLEHFNYEGPNGSMEMARLMAPADSYYTSDGGRFFWHKKPPTNWCVQALVKTEPRLVLRTPYLAARLINCRYTPMEHERSPFTDSAYFKDGGRTDRLGYGPSFYSPTA